jgi:transposase, IS5 family
VSICPAVTYRDVPAAITWLEAAFGPQGQIRDDGAAADRAMLRYGDGIVMVQLERPEDLHGSHTGQGWIYMVVDDADRHYHRRQRRRRHRRPHRGRRKPCRRAATDQAIARVARRAGRPPGAVAADRGYGEARVEADLHALGVRTVAIPRKGQPGAARRTVEHRRSFRTLVKWRTGCDGRIAHLQRRPGWDRTLLDGFTSARTWCGHGVFAHNLTKISALAA